jgi:hypothetical protein
MTWSLILQSFAVLRHDKKLVLFPVLSALAAAAVSAPFWIALFGTAPVEHAPWTPAHYAAMFFWYCACSFVIIFFNCALAACAQARFAGEEPQIMDGIYQAASHTWNIFLWAVASSTVGVILRAIEERVGWLGRIVTGLFGIGWSFATYLIVPVLVLEDQGLAGSIRRSAQLLRQTWGEQLIGGLHFGWMGLLLAIPGFILGVFAWPVGILYFLTLAAVLSAAREIFVVALYRYAVSGQAPDGYSDEALNGAFRRR